MPLFELCNILPFKIFASCSHQHIHTHRIWTHAVKCLTKKHDNGAYWAKSGTKKRTVRRQPHIDVIKKLLYVFNCI